LFNPMSEPKISKNDNLIDKYFQTLENHYKKLLDENKDNEEFKTQITENYTNTVEKINEIRTALPTIHKLIESFEK